MTDARGGPSGGDAARSSGRRRPMGPPAGLLALIVFALSVAAAVAPLLVAGAAFPTPAASPEEVAEYFKVHDLAGTLAGVFAYGAAVPLGIYSATVYARLLRLGVRVPGPGIAFFGGISASIVLAVGGLLTWALARSADGVPDPVLRLLLDVVFALGGVGFVGGIGLLIAGIAVPALILRLAPRWLAWVGLVLAAASEVSLFGLLWDGFHVLLPIGRFLGLLWLAAVAFLLPHSRHAVVDRTDRRER